MNLRHAGLKIGLILVAVVVTTGVTVILSAFAQVENKGEAATHETKLSVQTPFIPEQLSFCGEIVPLHRFDTRESLEREIIVNTYFHSQSILFIKKANRFFPVIEPILRQYNIPDDFKYLAVIESGLSNVVSPSGAKGYWQLLEGTARDYKLEINNEVDERYHLERATEAACKFINDSYDLFKDWTLVAASYNVGRRGVTRQMERQKETSYYSLLFNEETGRYVFRILAVKLLLENPEQYGFNLSKDELYPLIPYKEVSVMKKIEDLTVFAKANNTNYKTLKFLNPWLRTSKLTNPNQKEYLIKVPGTPH